MARKPQEEIGHIVKFDPIGIACRGGSGQTLLEIAADSKIPIRSDCGGRGRCGKCLVSVDPADHVSPMSDAESAQLSTDQLQMGLRLACQASLQGDATVAIAESAREDADAAAKTDVMGDFSCNPMVRRRVISIPALSFSAATAPRDFLAHVVSSASDRKLSFKELSALQSISRPECHRGDVTLVDHLEKGVTAVFPGKKEVSLGVAVDIGTTTLAVYLCSLASGRILSSAAASNPQRRFGEDVISRITLANEKEGGLAELKKTVVDEINRLIGQCLEAAQFEKRDIDEVTVVGNTTMEQIFMGIHPHGLGFSPYLPVTGRPHDLRAEDVGLDLHPAVNVFVFPVISGFVGGDTMGVILWDRTHEKKEVSLIVDIGTNGEVVLGNDRGLWTTSCATGPALEGAHIACGMRAAAGAVHRVRIEAGSYGVDCDVLAEDRGSLARGICGSGIIDTVAEMRKTGLLLPGGRIREGLPGVLLDEKGIGRRFVLVPSERSATGRQISIALEDVRQIQLAKAALFVGIKRLMAAAGFERFDRLVLTGAFGARFDWKNAVFIGMLPTIPEHATVEVVSNAAGRGAVAALLDRDRRKECIGLAERVRFLELAEDPDFALEFAAATAFPEFS